MKKIVILGCENTHANGFLDIITKNPDGSETAKTKKGDAVYSITIPKDRVGYPVVEKIK